ncbi:hypothetical protein DT23_13550 [Thioclava indica]|uniref:Uncharacterized protein n=1 Tax=Thioclava indica TaxID=1353528 RepID=A0A074KFC7_9RHOB|nr:hypothetical protein DT23_13550 [Thioclava indica]
MGDFQSRSALIALLFVDQVSFTQNAGENLSIP